MNTKKTSVETRGSCFCAIENGTHPFEKPKKETFLFFQTRADIARYVYFYENNYIYIYFYLYIYIRKILKILFLLHVCVQLLPCAHPL